MAKLKIKTVLYLRLTLSIIISCQNNQKIKIIETKATASIKPFQKNWTRENIPQKWIEIKKDKGGYLIYEPCDGNTVSIDFKKKKNVAQIRYQIETQNIEYDVTENINSGNKFFISFTKNKKQVLDIEATEYDAQNQIVLFKIDKHDTYLMTPINNKDSFRKVENKCEQGKVSELEFLPIN